MKNALSILFVLIFSLFAAPQNSLAQQPLIITRGSVVDVLSGKILPEMTIVIEGEKITRIGKTRKIKLPKKAQIVEASGKFLIPGLWDMHVHIDDAGEWMFPLFAANGVVGVRDLGSLPEQHSRWRESYKNGALMPQIYAAGPIVSGKIGDADPRMLLVGTAAEAEKAVADLAEKKVDLIKVHDWILPEAYFALINAAKKRGLTVAGHQPIALTATEISNAGQKSIEHFGSAFGGFLIDVSSDETALRRDARSLIPLTAPEFNPAKLFEKQGFNWERRLSDSYDARKAERLARIFVRNKTWITPTIQSFAYNAAFLTDAEVARDARLKYFPASIRKTQQEMAQNSQNAPAPNAGKMEGKKQLYQRQLEFVRALNRAGVGLLAGTDSLPFPTVFPGFSVHDELQKMVEAGLSPLEALRTATLNPAKYFNKTNEIGSLSVGKQADLILVDANPLADIKNTQKINAVILRGKYLDRNALDKILSDVETANNKK